MPQEWSPQPRTIYDTPGANIVWGPAPFDMPGVTVKGWATGGPGANGDPPPDEIREYDSGNFSDTFPAGATSADLEEWGGGGGGGTSGSATHGAGGGGSGGYCLKNYASPTGSYSGAVGAGGAPLADGSNSTFTVGAGTVTAGGGHHGNSPPAPNGGAGGSASGGDTNSTGNPGSDSNGSGGNGGNAPGGSGGSGGAGGAGGSNGGDGTAPGGGGGGGGSTVGPGGVGGSGGAGKVRLTIHFASMGGGAGGGGAEAQATLDLVEGDFLVLTIPDAVGPGVDGGDCTAYLNGSTLIVKAVGGKKGVGTTGGLGGNLASCIGDSATSGGKGGDAPGTGGGGGGGSGGDGSNGSNGSNGSGSTGGNGGTGGASGGAAGGRGGDNNADGANGNKPGGGAGGGGAGKSGGISGWGRVEVLWGDLPDWAFMDQYCCDATLKKHFEEAGATSPWLEFDGLIQAQGGGFRWAAERHGWKPYENYAIANFLGPGQPLTVDLAWVWELTLSGPDRPNVTGKIVVWCDHRGELTPPTEQNPYPWGQWAVWASDLLDAIGAAGYQVNGVGFGSPGGGVDQQQQGWPCNWSCNPGAGAPADGSFHLIIELHTILPGPESYFSTNIDIFGLVNPADRDFYDSDEDGLDDCDMDNPNTF